MILSIAQPAYLPWLGYFDRISRADVTIVLNHVQLERRGFTHRNKVLGPNGPIWLTIPLNKKGNFSLPIYQLSINNQTNWKKKHRETLRHCYSSTTFFSNYFNLISQIYDQDWCVLDELLRETTKQLFKILKITTPMLFSSEMKPVGTKSDLILNLCKDVGATTYISGPFGRDYLEQDKFEKNAIKIVYHDYVHPQYQQRNKQKFEPFMSIVDLIFNHGPDSFTILTKNQKLSEK